jgi:hypothetical protein
MSDTLLISAIALYNTEAKFLASDVLLFTPRVLATGFIRCTPVDLFSEVSSPRCIPSSYRLRHLMSADANLITFVLPIIGELLCFHFGIELPFLDQHIA